MSHSTSEQRAECARRLRATACSMLVQQEDRAECCGDSPMLAAAPGATGLLLADMAQPAPPQPIAMDAFAEAAAKRPQLPTLEGIPVRRLDAAERAPTAPLSLRTSPGRPEAVKQDERHVCESRRFALGEDVRQLCREIQAHLASEGQAAVACIRPAAEQAPVEQLIQLASALVEGGIKQAVLVDAQTGSRCISQSFHLCDSPGLLEALSRPSEALRHVRKTGLRGVNVLPCGGISAAISSNDTWHDVFRRLKAEYDYVVIDAPPGEPPHAAGLAEAADAVCITVSLARTPRRWAIDEIERLKSNSARTLGCVLLEAA